MHSGRFGASLGSLGLSLVAFGGHWGPICCRWVSIGVPLGVIGVPLGVVGDNFGVALRVSFLQHRRKIDLGKISVMMRRK